jgi:hypothetical protein
LFDMPAKESDSRLPRQHFSPETAQSSQYTAPPRIRDCERFPSKQLTAFLTDPHPKMPDMNLTRSEIADIVAYIGTLDR